MALYRWNNTGHASSNRFAPIPDDSQTYEQKHDKTSNITFAPSRDSDQPGHPPSLITVFAVRSVGS